MEFFAVVLGFVGGGTPSGPPDGKSMLLCRYAQGVFFKYKSPAGGGCGAFDLGLRVSGG